MSPFFILFSDLNGRVVIKAMNKRISALLKFNSSRVYLEEFVRLAALSVDTNATVLDAGAGEGPYKYLFSHTNYESADICEIERNYGDITYVCDLIDIPVLNERYNLVLLTQVLEHVPEPLLVLKEMNRILKPGAELWLSAPLFFEEHEVPYDFFRYTQYGFNHLLMASGFRIKQIEWLEGYYGTLSYQLRMAAKALPSAPVQYGGGILGVIMALVSLILRPVFFVLSLLFARLDVKNKYVDSGQCKNYAIVAVKE